MHDQLMFYASFICCLFSLLCNLIHMVLKLIGTNTYNHNWNFFFNYSTLVLLSTHVGGSFLALILCYRLNLRKGVTCLWFFQTLLFGMGSLQYLLNPQNALVNIFCEK